MSEPGAFAYVCPSGHRLITLQRVSGERVKALACREPGCISMTGDGIPAAAGETPTHEWLMATKSERAKSNWNSRHRFANGWLVLKEIA